MHDCQNIRLRIVSRMRDAAGSCEEIRHARTGTLREEADGTLLLAYDDEQDGERAQISLSATPRHARMERRGMTRATLCFEPGARTSSVYSTLYGEIPVQIDTRNVNLTRQANGGELALDYDVYMGGEFTTQTRLCVTWRL